MIPSPIISIHPKMVSTHMEAPPVLSTPDTHIFEDPTPPVDISSLPRLSDEQLAITYEIQRTIKEIREGKWKKIALQFPDEMLVDAPRVYWRLRDGLRRESKFSRNKGTNSESGSGVTEKGTNEMSLEQNMGQLEVTNEAENIEEEKLCILADTSYGSCCVDEIAAEHVEAEVVVHYGRSCLSPTTRLPVIYVYTTKPLSIEDTLVAFRDVYHEDKGQKIILMTDIPYSSYLPKFVRKLTAEGWTAVFATDVIHNPSSQLPNRTVPEEVATDSEKLKDWKIFHIGPPPTALLLILSSRVGNIHIYNPQSPTYSKTAIQASSSQPLRRRYALLTSLSTVSTYGILINTLSVSNYLDILAYVKQQIAAAGKKSYTFVVGKINAAKIANFAEIGGWVVIGCWESSLIESGEFWRPVITPFELGFALMGDGERVWTGVWESDFQQLLKVDRNGTVSGVEAKQEGDANSEEEDDDEEDSAPPEFDLRTGRYVSHTRPMQSTIRNGSSKTISTGKKPLSSLIKRANGDIAQIGGVVSPGAEFLRGGRTWQGLGSDFEIAYEHDGGLVEEGRSGIARGYADGTESAKR